MNDIFLNSLQSGQAGNIPPRQQSALVLAYIGDCVFELFIRMNLVNKRNTTVERLHIEATKLVCASAQAASFRAIEHILTDEELAIYKRGRNAKSKPPKNADMTEYKIATGFEALIGYLYLMKDEARLLHILEQSIS